ncbi:MAG: SDR family oxidoreductase [Syntrophomonadaceae bacterium]|jgi:nucleoside-diphosphate-sugar epimerase|nr:SDR family oxidoreductase [Syntrophomonadaceae bacterium]
MRIFVTGSTGFIGSAVVRELLDTGHAVTGLARSESSAQWLKKTGAAIHAGSLEDIDSLKRGADSADAVIHIAFAHNFSDFGAAVETDRRAIEALGEALAGSGRPFIVTSGVPAGKNGHTVTESDDSDPALFPRLSEAAALPFAKRGVRVSVIRPSRLVHGEGDTHGFIPQFIDIARKTGVSAYAGNGRNRCQAAHRLDVAHLFCLALEKGVAGARYQAVADAGIAFRAIAEAIGGGLNIPVISIPAEEAVNHFGFPGQIMGIDNPASSEITQKTLGWHPTHPSLLQDLSSDCYFAQTDF